MDESPEITTTLPQEQRIVIADEVLVSRLGSGEVSAGDELVRRYCQPLLRYLHRLAGNATVAEELHQQTWVSVLEHLGRFDDSSGPGSFKAWLFRIATNKVHDFWRARGREGKAEDALTLVVSEKCDSEPSGAMESSETQRKVQEAIDQLPEVQKQVVCMRYYANMKFVDIAEVLGCPLNTALGRMHKAVLRLRSLLGR
jgi:RNA polymerase sigma-70 factor (ECF subfamily)